jgi:hypothetical protein
MAVTAAWWGMRVPGSDEEFVIMLRPDGSGSLEETVRPRLARASVLGVADLFFTERE